MAISRNKYFSFLIRKNCNAHSVFPWHSFLCVKLICYFEFKQYFIFNWPVKVRKWGIWWYENEVYLLHKNTSKPQKSILQIFSLTLHFMAQAGKTWMRLQFQPDFCLWEINSINFLLAFYKQVCEVFPVIAMKVKPPGLIQLFCL